MSPASLSLDAAHAHLAHADAVMAGLLQRQTIKLPAPRTDYYASLVRTIIGQQISVASAQATYGRLEAATGIDPQTVHATTGSDAVEDGRAKAIGLSRQKAGYLHDLSAHFIDNPAIYDHLDSLSDEDVIADLTAIKGIGVWSAQMFLIFTLQRSDVFAPLDIGVQNAMIPLYGLQKPLDLKQLEAIAESWRPYRSVALLHLWQSLDTKPLDTA